MAISTCCGCCSLQKGSIIIGFLYFISAAIVVIYQAIVLSSSFSKEYVPNNELSARAIIIGLIFYSIILLTMTGVLIAGAINRLTSYVFFFVSMHFGNIVLTFSYFVFETSYMFMSPAVLPVKVVIYVTCAAIGMSINIYMWLVVYNFYQELVTDKFRKVFQQNTMNYSHPVVPGMVYSS